MIQNMPLISLYPDGAANCISVNFDFPVPAGTDITEVMAGWTLENDPSPIPPPPIDFVTVSDVNFSMYGGFPGFPGVTAAVNPFIIFPPIPIVDFAFRPGPYYNQECNPDECVPTAVSNSLKYLHDSSGKPPDGKPTDIKTMKKAVGQTGTYAAANWGATKKSYMDSNGYDVDTDEIPASGGSTSHDATTADLDAAMQAIKDGKDVEMNGRYHCAQVVGIVKCANGTYIITIKHDEDQDDPKSGTVTDNVTYDPNGNPPYVMGGTMMLEPHALNGFVVEGPK